MKPVRKPDYGIDAPTAVRNMLIVAALGVVSLIARLFGLWSRHDAIAAIARPLMSAGVGAGVGAVWMIYDSRIGKVRERECFLDRITWRGNERVLDVGCGRGLFLVGAAKRLTTGSAVGIDIWNAEDLSGNTPSAPLDNARMEGVSDKVEVQTADARRLPFADATFDVVLSSMALHNIYSASERQTAVREIALVLKTGGRVLIVDVRHLRQYATTLRDAGVDGRSVQGVLPPMRIKPEQYAIGAFVLFSVASLWETALRPVSTGRFRTVTSCSSRHPAEPRPASSSSRSAVCRDRPVRSARRLSWTSPSRRA